MHEKDVVLIFFMPEFIFHNIFGPKKNKLLSPVFVFGRDMSNVLCDLVLYMQSEGLSISWLYPGTISFQYLNMVFRIQYSSPSLAGS